MNRSNKKIIYCRECGAEVYTNEKKCWNCGAETTSSKIGYIILIILCVCAFGFTMYMYVSGSKSTYNNGYKEGKAVGVQEGVDDTTEKYEEYIAELNGTHEEELETVKSTFYETGREEGYALGKEEGVANYKKKLKKKKQEAKKKQEEEEVRKQETLEVNALDLVTLYNDNQISYVNTYKGRFVRTSGKIGSMRVNSYDESKWIVSIETDYSNIFMNTIDCILSPEGKSKIEAYKEGDIITVEGVAGDSFMTATIEDCNIL